MREQDRNFFPGEKKDENFFINFSLLFYTQHHYLTELSHLKVELRNYEAPYQVLISNNQEVTDFSRILLMYASISLFLTLFGLFGITHYAIQQRIREIGIRKIHGASFGQILWLVNRPFLYYIGIAFILIVPLVCYLMNYWLQQFAYHVHIGILHFLLPLFFTVCITLLKVFLNSYREARNNPVDSIKYE